MLYRLLDEYRPHVGNPLKMIELQKAIESLSLERFTDASIAYRRFPALMGRLLQPDKIDAKDFILSRKGAKLTESDRCLLNAMDRYDLELLSLRVMSIFFTDIAESALVRTASFLSQLQKHIVFMYDVGLQRRTSTPLEFKKPDESLMSEYENEESLDLNSDKEYEKTPITKRSAKMGFTILSYLVDGVSGDERDSSYSNW